jgi:hypothetical protein
MSGSAVRIVDPLEVPNWDKQVLRLPGCTFFYSSAWARVLVESYGYKPLYFTIFDGEALSACLPVMEVDSFLTGRRGVSLPFTDYCEPIVSTPGQFHELFEKAAEYGKRRGWKSLELRGANEYLHDSPPSSTYLTHTLALTASEAPVFSSFRESNRRNIRKAVASCLNVQIAASKEAIRQFYRLNQITRREHGLPPQPLRFFEKVHEHVIWKGLGFVALAHRENAAVAASVYFHFGGAAIYKYGASNKRYQHLRPNNLVMWEAIRRCIQTGCTSLSLGRTDVDGDGLRQFKAGWGAKEQPINYYKQDIKTREFLSDSRRTNGVTSKVAACLPLPILRAAGILLYRHMA